MTRRRWQIMMGCLALAVLGVLAWADQRTVCSAGNALSQPMQEQLVESSQITPVTDEPLSPVLLQPPPSPTAPSVLQTSSPVTVSEPSASEFPADPCPPILPRPSTLIDHETPPPPLALAPITLPAPTVECDETPVTPPTPTVEPPLIRPVVDVSGPVATVSPSAAPAVTPFPWRLSMEMVGPMTQFEVRRGDESLLRVQCEALDLSTPGGGLIARGKVAVSGPCHEARCERLTIAWQSGEVALDGSVQLSFRHEGVVQMMRAESLTFRLGGANQPIEFTTRDVHIKVSPKP